MKKILMLLVGGLLLSVAASASTITVSCNGTANLGSGTWFIASFQLICPQFEPPVGDTINSAEIFSQESFNQGQFNNPANQVTFSYTSALPGLGLPLGDYASVLNGIAGADYFVGADYYQFGDTLTGAGWTGVGGVDVAIVSAAKTGGTLTSGSNDSVNFYVEYSYTLLQPEPMTMVLVGGGLLGVGLLAGKRRKKV